MSIQPRWVQQYLVNAAWFFYLQVLGCGVCHFQIKGGHFVRVLEEEIFEDRKVIFVNPKFLFHAVELFVPNELHFRILWYILLLGSEYYYRGSHVRLCHLVITTTFGVGFNHIRVSHMDHMIWSRVEPHNSTCKVLQNVIQP